MNTKLRKPACAACAATEFARLPVDAHAAVLNPNSSAFESATDVTRSLNEFVGFTRVVLDPQLTEAELGGEPVGADERREAGTEVHRRVPLHRQQVRVPPEAERPGGDLLPSRSTLAIAS